MVRRYREEIETVARRLFQEKPEFRKTTTRVLVHAVAKRIPDYSKLGAPRQKYLRDQVSKHLKAAGYIPARASTLHPVKGKQRVTGAG